MQLREYQIEAINNLRTSFQKGNKAPLLVMPTGSGKTVVFAEISKRLRQNKNNVLILVHRKELIDQASKKLKAIKVTHGIIAAKYKGSKSSIQIASVQTLVRRLSSNTFIPNYIIIDEAHHAAAGSWDKILSSFPDSYKIGCTATPIRLDGRGLKDYFDDLIFSYSISKLIKLNYLAPYKVFAPPLNLNLDKVKVLAGDFQKKDLEKKMDQRNIVGDAVEQYKRHADGLPAIAFCISVKHAKKVCDQFNSAGYKSAIVHGEMTTDERDEVIKGLGNGKIQVLTSVDVISEGTDCPNVSVAILLRATKSEGLYLQQVGRILRPNNDKTAIILDHVNATRTHGFVDDERNWSLNSEKKSRKKSEIAPKVETCKKCFAAYKPQPKCPVCGYQAQTRDARFIRQEQGELVELKKKEKQETEKQQEKQLIATARTLQELQQVAKILGYKQGWAYKVFQSRQRKNISFNNLNSNLLKPNMKLKSPLSMVTKERIAKIFASNEEAFNLLKKQDAEKIFNGNNYTAGVVFSKIAPSLKGVKNKKHYKDCFFEMYKYSWDRNFIINYVKNIHRQNIDIDINSLFES